MKRRPVLLFLALVIVALFADDVRFLVQLSVADEVRSIVAVDSDCHAPMTAIRLIDGAGAVIEVDRNGRPFRDSVAKPFAELHSPINLACAGLLANCGQTPPPLSSLVSQHTRLQV